MQASAPSNVYSDKAMDTMAFNEPTRDAIKKAIDKVTEAYYRLGMMPLVSFVIGSHFCKLLKESFMMIRSMRIIPRSTR